MWRSRILFLSLACLVVAMLPAADQRERVKPATVETKKQADTQLFIKTVPDGAKVVVDGKEVGASPYLFEVPSGATKMTVEVELDGYPGDQRTIVIQGGRITRVIFDLEDKKVTTAVAPGSGARAVAEAFFHAVVQGKYEDALALSEGIDAKGLREARKNLDLSGSRIDRVFSAGTMACAISTTFAALDGDVRCALGFGLIRRGERWLVRDVDILPDYEKAREFVESFRRQFPLTAEESHASASEKKASSATGGDVRKMALRYGRALAEADAPILEEFWKLDDPLDREAADILLAALRKAHWKSSGPSIRIELVHHARMGDDGLTVCYYADPGLSPDGSPTPIFQYFELEDGRWRTQPLPNLRIMAGIDGDDPDRMQRRLLVQKLIGLRFGPWTREKLVASMRAQVETFKALTGPPYEMSQFQGAAESLEKQLSKDEKLAKYSWPGMEEMVLSDPEAGDVGSPDDFYLAFYLEAPEGQKARKLPQADSGEAFAAERVPSLTDQDVEKATVDEGVPGPGVQVVLTEFGTEVLGRVTREHIGKRLAIVVDGKVVSAPVIREVIAGGRAAISGSFTLAEAEEMAKQLNSYREKCHAYLETMRRGMLGEPPSSGDKAKN